MANLPSEKLTGEEYVILQEAIGNSALFGALRKIFAFEERQKLEAMRSEAVSAGRPAIIVQYAAESRVYAELDGLIRKRMEQLAPQRKS